MRSTSRMERIKLSKEEKLVFLHVAKYENKQPRNITLVMFHYCLATLKEKGLVDFRANYEVILEAGLTVKGASYLEQNPKLKNPIDWKWIIPNLILAITAIATIIGLFIDL
ncbi:MAG: hypothetical protein J6L02_00040 [Bacteroidales bacterium]|nr:hypothetical protein [Bacteroidales bacterium]